MRERRMPDSVETEPSLEQQIVMLKEQLAQAQKLTALGELVSTTTHEFNNVLTTIINYAKLGLRHKDQATREKAFEKILAAGTRAAKITNSILGFARNRTNSFEPTDLVKLVDDSLLLLEREMNKYRITVERSIAAVPAALANPNQIQQVLMNLLINARQAMPQGGRVLVKLALRRREQHGRPDRSRQRLRHVARDAAADLRAVLHDQVRARRQRQGRHRPGTVDVPRHHRSPSRANPRRQQRGQGDGLHAQAARCATKTARPRRGCRCTAVGRQRTMRVAIRASGCACASDSGWHALSGAKGVATRVSANRSALARRSRPSGRAP